MQVKKFEAKTMREALELVKQHLGPEAIILSAKDNSRGFGLVGEKSVEVTAAISDETLRRKKAAESRLNPQNRQKYESAPARVQRKFIEKATDRTLRPAASPMGQVALTPSDRPLRYADIMDEEAQEMARPATVARQRVQDATRRAREAFEAGHVTSVSPTSHRESASAKEAHQAKEILDLKGQIEELKNIISEFQKIPQTFVPRHPGADEGIHYELSSLYQKLLRGGLGEGLVVETLKAAQESMPATDLKRAPLVEAWVARRFLDQTVVVKEWASGRFHLFVGPAGQGKTTSLVKFASHLALVEGRKVGIVCADSRKVGAAEQMRIYAQILNVPFAVVSSPQDWDEVLCRWGGVQSILVDFPSLTLKDGAEAERWQALLPDATGGRTIHYVQSVLAKDETAFEVADRYRTLGFDDVIFTGLDEAAHHGIILNFQRRYQVPIHSFSTGQNVPEDYEAATKERVVDLIFKLTKLKKEAKP